MDTWHLVFLVKNLNWLGFLENLLASCSLQQFQVKSSLKTRELKWQNLWQATFESHLPVPSKIKPRLFTSCFITANDRAKFDYWGGRKTLLFYIVWWHGYREYRGFSKQSPWRYWLKKLFILTSWGTSKKLMLIEGCWLTSILLPNYL